MNITNEDRLNLLHVLSQTKFYESIVRGPGIELQSDEIGLDRKRWSDIIQRLIDNENAKQI